VKKSKSNKKVTKNPKKRKLKDLDDGDSDSSEFVLKPSKKRKINVFEDLNEAND